MTHHHDITVIGAGMVGVCTALHLLHQGRKVLLIDRRGPGQETSYGNAGVLGGGYVLPFGFPSWKRFPNILRGRDPMARICYASLPQILPWIIDFYFKSRPGPRHRSGRLLHPLISTTVDEHRGLMQGTGAERHLSLGRQVTLYRSKTSFVRDAGERAFANEMNVPFEIMDMNAFRYIEPNINPVFYNAVSWPGSGHLNNPGAVVTAYATRFAREGGVFVQTEMLGMKYHDGVWEIETPGTGFSTQNVVICAGPWATDMLKPLGYHFPLAAKRGYHQHYRAAGSAKLSHAITDAEHGYVIAPMEQGYRLTTGAEFAGRDDPPTPVQIDRILPLARGLFPFTEAIDPAPWLGSRPCFTDSLPVIGAASRHTGLWLNIGHGHMGMTMGPSTARLLAEMMCGKQPFCDPQPYRATRFSC